MNVAVHSVELVVIKHSTSKYTIEIETLILS